MAYGLSWINNAGKIAISSDYYGLMFVGNATFTSAVKSDAFSQINPDPPLGGYVAGARDDFHVYTLVSAAPPICFLQVTNGAFAVCAVTNTGGNNWQIVVGGSGWTTPPIIKCFARVPATGGTGGYGLRVFDANGVPTWDSTAPMLVLKQRDSWAAFSDLTGNQVTQSITLSGFTAPYVLSLAQAQVSNTQNSPIDGQGMYTMTESISGWSGSATTLQRRSLDIIASKYKTDAPIKFNELPATVTYLIDGSKYP